MEGRYKLIWGHWFSFWAFPVIVKIFKNSQNLINLKITISYTYQITHFQYSNQLVHLTFIIPSFSLAPNTEFNPHQNNQNNRNSPSIHLSNIKIRTNDHRCSLFPFVYRLVNQDSPKFSLIFDNLPRFYQDFDIPPTFFIQIQLQSPVDRSESRSMKLCVWIACILRPKMQRRFYLC